MTTYRDPKLKCKQPRTSSVTKILTFLTNKQLDYFEKQFPLILVKWMIKCK